MQFKGLLDAEMIAREDYAAGVSFWGGRIIKSKVLSRDYCFILKSLMVLESSMSAGGE